MFSDNNDNYIDSKNNSRNNRANNNNNNNCNNNKSIQNNNKDPLIQFLEKIIVIRDSQSTINHLNFFGTTKKEIYILISKNYMDKFESHMNFKEINEIIINKKMKITTSNINQNIKEINELKDLIKDKPFTKNLGNIVIKDKFACIYDLSKKGKGMEKNIKLDYIDNAQIITKELLNVIKSIDKNFLDNYTKKCIFSDNKIIFKLNDNILNVGGFDNNHIFIPELIIFSKTSWNIDKIKEKIKEEGYNSLIKLVNNDLINFSTNSDKNIKVEAKIIKIDSISDKLKCIILLFINSKRLLSIDKSKNYEKVFLINKKCLEQYINQYNEIVSLIEKNEEVNKYIEKIIKYSFQMDYLNNIISKLDKQSLKNIDEMMKNDKEPISFNLNYDIAKLFDKQINIMKDFIIVNEFIFDCMKNIVDSSICKQNYGFFLHKEGAIITNEINSQYFILIGNLDNKNNIYEIKYILDFNLKDSFENEKNIISSSNLENYIKTRMIYNDKRNDDYVSPIFNEKKIVGNSYLYKEDLDYTSCTNYSKILSDKSNTMIMNSINIYLNTQRIIKNMKKKKAETQKYYLINKNLINQIKIDNDYKIIKDIIETNNFKEDEDNNKKNILSLIKSLPEDDFNKYTKEISSKIKYDQQIEPDIIQACYFDETNKSIFIYDFDLFKKEIIELLIDDLSKLKDYYLDCTLIEDKIIINFPDNLNQKQYISVIGTINSEYDFDTEYFLIFKDKTNQDRHMRTILSGLSKYLNELQLVNNSQPILKDGTSCEIIGTIVKYDPYFQPEIKTTIIDNYLPKDDSKNKTTTATDNASNSDSKADTPFIKNNFKESPLIGLQNIGATCYMNSTLQCLCHIEKFINFFKYDEQAENLAKNNKDKLVSSFKLLIDNLWPNNYKKGVTEKYYVPQEFKEKISKMNPLFEGIAANDAKDLVNFIIMTLHLELNRVKGNNNNIVKNKSINQSDPQAMFKCFLEDYQKENNSIINELFYAINCNSTQCTICKNYLINYQTYFFLIFPLEEVRKNKENNINNNNNFNINYNNNYNNNFNNFNNGLNNNYNNLSQSYNANNYNNLSQSYNANNYNNLNQSYNANNFNNLNQSYNANNYNNLNQSLNSYNNIYNNVSNNYNNMAGNFNNLSKSVRVNNSNNLNITVNNNSNSSINNINGVTIYDCFDFDRKVNLMSGGNQMYCNNCKCNTDCTICTNLVTGPEILIIILNRGQGIEFDVKINFEEELDLSNYIQFNNKSRMYQLIGVITHIGESSMSGHFIAYCKDPISGKWHKYNDAMVNEVENFQNEVINFAMPYLLFYQRK